MKEHFLPILTIAVVIMCSLVLGYMYLEPRSDEYLKNQIPSVAIRDVGINVTVAKTEADLVHGLSGKKSLGERDGLLMIFNTPDFHEIWMKDMLFPIDIIWIDDTLTIVDITESVTPDSYPKIFEPRIPARMALEVNARFAAIYHLKVGDAVLMNDAIIPSDIATRLKK
jgi:uncharacterized membrane protein (UPF0127 family)